MDDGYIGEMGWDEIELCGWHGKRWGGMRWMDERDGVGWVDMECFEVGGMEKDGVRQRGTVEQRPPRTTTPSDVPQP